jgi:ubiquitin-small subunit ribosomal protein S27Ae
MIRLIKNSSELVNNEGLEEGDILELNVDISGGMRAKWRKKRMRRLRRKRRKMRMRAR